MNIIQKYLNNQIARLGYIKAGDVPENVIFRGETMPGSEQNIWADWRLENFQKLAMSHPVFFSNAKLIADQVAMGVAMIEQQTGPETWEGVVGHPFEIIAEQRPNPYQSQAYVWWYQTMWLLLQGEAYWMLVEDGTGELTRMYPLPANRIKPIPDPERLFRGFAYTPVDGHQPIILEPEQVCFHRVPNVFDYHRGFSLLSSFLHQLKLSSEADKFDLDDYDNGLTLKTLISLRPEISQRDKAQFDADIEAANRAGKRYLTARGGDISATALAARRDEKSGQETTHQRIDRLANLVLGIPDGMRSKDGNRANIEGSYQQFIELTVWPLMMFLAEDMTAQTVIPHYGDGLRMMFEDIRPKNRELEIAERESKRGVMTVDEAREAEGLDPYEDEGIGTVLYPAAVEVIKANLLGTIASPGEGGDIVKDEFETLPQLALNGAQVTAALEIVTKVNSGELARDSGQGALEIMFNLTPEQALRILGSGVFTPSPPPPPDFDPEGAIPDDITEKAAEPFTPKGKLVIKDDDAAALAAELEERSKEFLRLYNQVNPDAELEITTNGNGDA